MICILLCYDNLQFPYHNGDTITMIGGILIVTKFVIVMESIRKQNTRISNNIDILIDYYDNYDIMIMISYKIVVFMDLQIATIPSMLKRHIAFQNGTQGGLGSLPSTAG